MPSPRLTWFLAILVPACAALGADEVAATPPSDVTLHAQSTYILQMNPGFNSPYQGMNSFDPNQESRHTVSLTLFLGHTLWPAASLYYDPEFTQGSGLSNTTGIADFPNGEGSRASSINPQYATARLFIREVMNLGGAEAKVDDDENQVAGAVTDNRLTFTAGKFSVADIFDSNAYSHDARTQFLNWALVDDGAWDYPADAKGYTAGFTAEWSMGPRTLRYGIFMEPAVANELPLDTHIDKAFGQAFEWEERYTSDGHPAAIRFLAFWNRAHMGLYQAALEESAPPDITLSREYRSKAGAGLNWEQEIADGLGAFARAGFDDGRTETWAYTEIDESISGGLSLSGRRWGRSDDTLGIAGVASGLSSDHKKYLEAGGYGFIIGDGRLSYEAERVLETYYSLKVDKWLTLSLDYQFVEDPGYNRDRGPVSVFGVRAHAEY
ncbi:MAG TPA: carbohydrate porin [Opitutaceae bacterium]|nr:carbohydrate porin [Opitutaceae bacterium]